MRRLNRNESLLVLYRFCSFLLFFLSNSHFVLSDKNHQQLIALTTVQTNDAHLSETKDQVIVASDRCQDAGSGVYFVSPGLLQLDFYGVTDGLMSRLQSVQNVAARLVSGARRHDHITPVLQELHCLPVRRRVDFEMANLVCMSLSGMALVYLAAECQLVSDEGRRQLRSVNSRTCVVRRTYSSYKDKRFAAADVSNRKGEQSRQLLELRQRRDIRQVAPRRTELYNDYDDVHHSRLVNRLQDKVIKLENSMRKELALGRIHDKRLLAKSGVIYHKLKQKLKEEKKEKKKEEEEKKLEQRSTDQKSKSRLTVRNGVERDDEYNTQKRGAPRRKKKSRNKRNKTKRKKNKKRRSRGRRKKGKRKRKGRKKSQLKKGIKQKLSMVKTMNEISQIKKKTGKMLKEKRKAKKKKRNMERKMRKKLQKGRKRRRRKWKIGKKRRRRKRKRRGRKGKRGRKRKRKRRRKGKRRRRRQRKRRKRGKRRKRKRKGRKGKKKWRRKRRRRRKGKRKKKRKMQRKRKVGRKSKNLSLIEILKKLNQADYSTAAVRGTTLGLANRLIRVLTRAHRVARSWRSLRRRVPLVRTVKVFTVLLRRSERLISTIEKRRTTHMRRPALIRRLRLALLYLDAILTDLRRAGQVIRTRTGSPRVLALLKLAVKTQRSAIWRAIHGTTRPRPKPKPTGGTAAKQAATGTIYVKYLNKSGVELSTLLPSGSVLKLRLPKKNAWKAINYTFHISPQLARFVTALVSASSTDRTDRWTEWANWTACSVNQCGEAGLRTRRRVCVSTTGAVCTPGTARATEPCLGGGLACAAAARALTKISCLVGSETKQQLLNKTYIGKCLNGGLCQAVSTGLYQCHCPPSHMGQRCEKDTFGKYVPCQAAEVFSQFSGQYVYDTCEENRVVDFLSR